MNVGRVGPQLLMPSRERQGKQGLRGLSLLTPLPHLLCLRNSSFGTGTCMDFRLQTKIDFPSVSVEYSRHCSLFKFNFFICDYKWFRRLCVLRCTATWFSCRCMYAHFVCTCGWMHVFNWSFLAQRRRQWQPTPVFLPGESQGRGSLVGYRLWGRTESDTTEAT